MTISSNWYDSCLKAMDAFHEEEYETALSLFTALMEQAETLEEEVQTNIWLLQCNVKLHKFEVAQELVQELLAQTSQKNVSKSLKEKILLAHAAFFAEQYDFDNALAIYKELVKNTHDYDSLMHYEYLINATIADHESFLENGSIVELQNSLVKKIDEHLESVR